MYLRSEIVIVVLCAYKRNENACIRTFSTANKTKGSKPDKEYKQNETKALNLHVKHNQPDTKALHAM